MEAELLDHYCFQSYQEQLQMAREGFAHSSTILRLFDRELDGRVLHLFLIYFAGIGVAITKPVERWIRTAGDRCLELGLDDLGHALHQHARDEAGHDLMHLDDVNILVDKWNDRYREQFTACEIVNSVLLPGAQSYIALHETVIQGNSPYVQLAIELEIEALSLRFGAPFIKHCVGILGKQFFEGLSFIKHHVALDEGHTRFNERQLQKLLSRNPEYLPDLIAAGRQALNCYHDFVKDCLILAEQGGNSSNP